MLQNLLQLGTNLPVRAVCFCFSQQQVRSAAAVDQQQPQPVQLPEVIWTPARLTAAAVHLLMCAVTGPEHPQ